MNRISKNWHLFIWAIAVMNVVFAFVQLANGRSLATANSLILAAWIGIAGSFYTQLMGAREENADIPALLDHIDRLREQNSRLKAGSLTPAEREDWRANYLNAEAGIDQALKLHQAEDYCGNDRHTNPDALCPDCTTTCTECGEHYPCATIQALDGD